MSRSIDTVWHTAREVFLPFDGVVGVGWGAKLRAGRVVEQGAVIVFVDRKLAPGDVPDGQLIPPAFEGVLTDVRVPRLTPGPVDDKTGLPAGLCLPDVQWIHWPKIHRQWLDAHSGAYAVGGEGEAG